MKEVTKDFAFVLANTVKGYVLTTYKVGSITLQSNATDFLQFYKYLNGTLINFGNNRIHKGDPAIAQDILDNEHVTCLLRDPYDRTITGIVQELLAHEYKHYPGAHKLASANPILLWLTERYYFPFTTINEGNEVHHYHADSHKMIQQIVEYFMTQPVFKQEWERWWKEVIPFTWDKLKLSSHVRKYNEPLHYFIKDGRLKNYSTCLLKDINFEHNYFHSNWMFRTPVDDALKSILSNNSVFTKDFNSYIEREKKYFDLLNDAKENKD